MKILKVVLIVVAILIATGYYFLQPSDPVVKEVVKVEKSPNGKFQAIVFTDIGGNATVDFSNNVVILKADESLSRNQTVNSDQIIFKGYHIHNTNVTWDTDNTLVIFHNYDSGIIKSETDKNNIKIRYIKTDEI